MRGKTIHVQVKKSSQIPGYFIGRNNTITFEFQFLKDSIFRK